MILNKKEAGKEFSLILQFIDQVYSELHYIQDTRSLKFKIINSNLSNSEGEYGFYIQSHDSRTKLFFGIWLEIWGLTGYPVCISLETDRIDYHKLYSNYEILLKKHQNEINKIINYDNVTIGCIDNNLIFKTDTEEDVAMFLDTFVQNIGFQEMKMIY